MLICLTNSVPVSLSKFNYKTNLLSGRGGSDILQRDEDVVRLDIQVGQLLAVDILQTLENYNKIYQ